MSRVRTDSPPPRPPSTTARRPGRRPSAAGRVLTVLGVLLLVVGIGCLGYVGYQVFGTNVTAQRAQDAERDRLRADWERGVGETGNDADPKQAAAIPGEAVALLSIPAIGVQQVPVLEGTGDRVLARGIGHYDQTAAAGEIGNFAVAGHRITHGEPFADLLELRAGDEVVVETRKAIHTYAVSEPPQKLTVTETETWVLDPVPGKPGTEPSRAMITLTTCQDLFHSPDRSVGFGRLVHTERK